MAQSCLQGDQINQHAELKLLHFSRPYCHCIVVPTWSSVSEQWTCRAQASLVSLMHSFFKITFWTHLSWCADLCLTGDQKNMQRLPRYHWWIAFPPIFWVQFYWLIELCLLGDLNKHEKASLVSLMNGLFKTIFWVHSWETKTNLQRFLRCHW